MTTDVADGVSCDNDDVCDGVETCQAGVCTADVSLNCDDNNPCTEDTCLADAGCHSQDLVNGTACGDGDLCNGNETCQAGGCSPGVAPLCDDSNPCTLDTCGAIEGCQNIDLPDGSSCADGSVCNGDETCQDGTCTSGLAPLCDDDNPCTLDTCEGDTCQHELDPAAAAACPTPDNQCQVAACDVETGGCTAVDLDPGTPCDDGNFCSTGDLCYAGMCVGYANDALGNPICPKDCLDASAWMTCGDHASFELDGALGSNLLEAYNCDGAEGFTGYETAFLVTPPNLAFELPLTLAVELADPLLKGEAFADIVVLHATDDYQCWPDQCVDVGYMDSDGVATLELPAFVDSDGDATNDPGYIIVVDGRDGFDGAVRLSAWCPPGYTGIELYCTDGIDDDTDGMIDCADPSCWDSLTCLFEHDCDNGIDDDDDGGLDCDDPDCAEHPDCFVETVCDDGIDDEGDGLTDCDDSDCELTIACSSDCPGAIPVACGETLTGEDATTGSTTFTSFPCSPTGVGIPSDPYTHPHHVYHVAAPAGCSATVQVTPTPGPGDFEVLDIYAMAPSCEVDQCVQVTGDAGCSNPQTPATAFGSTACVQLPASHASSAWVTVIPPDSLLAWSSTFTYDLEVLCSCP
jgi:hypothetical protein